MTATWERDDDELDDVPSTHLDDDEYHAFLHRELDGRGRLRAGPQVVVVIGLLVLLVLAVAVVTLG